MCAYTAASNEFYYPCYYSCRKNRSKYVATSFANGATLYCATAFKQQIAQNGQ